MYLLRFVLKNSLRHKLRTTLTVVGIVVAITAFGLLRTIVDAWYAGANASSSARLVTRNSISLAFALPLTYAQRIRQVPGVASVSWANWFGGVYISERNFFPQFAIDAETYLDMYPEYVLPADERKAFLLDREACIVGRKLADQYGWKVGDQIPLRGTIFPGTWTFNLRGIYDGIDKSTDKATFFFHWSLLNETMRKRFPRRADQTGVFIEKLADPGDAAAVSSDIDAVFRNSLAETLTETEKGIPTRLRRHDRNHPAGDPGGVVRGDLHHPGGDGEYHGDDGPRAQLGICHDEGAGIRSRACCDAHFRRVDSSLRFSAVSSASR